MAEERSVKLRLETLIIEPRLELVSFLTFESLEYIAI